jgi:hypothetical protein
LQPVEDELQSNKDLLLSLVILAQEKCNGDVCGMFRITWAYWADGGKPTIGGEEQTSQTGHFFQ